MCMLLSRRFASQSAGFTLVEMIVSLALFSVVVTITVGALLSLIGSNDQLRGQQAVMTNLAFALDSMTREIRTGSYYHCPAATSTIATGIQESLGTTTRDCTPGAGISFIEGGDSITGVVNRRVAYYLDGSQIMRRVGNGTPQSMTADGIHIAEMRWWVTGSRPLSVGNTGGGLEQPTVTIFIDARESASGDPNYVQTTITQRALDL